jgi:hypothetical protein
MKRCPSCKNEYADNVAVCPADGTILDLEMPEYASASETAAANADAVPHVAETVDRVGTAAAETFDRDAEISRTGGETIGDGASTAAISQTDDSLDDDYSENPLFGWLVPLIIMILLIILGYWFCGKSGAPTASMPETDRNHIENRLI